jgi:hypothetical protein
MAQMLHILAEEVAQNKRLANRLAQPWLALMAEALKSEQESKPKKKASIKEPPSVDPFKAYLEGGSILLIKALEDIDAAECKTIISHFALDPSRSYVRWRKKEKLVELIIQRVKAVVSKGEVFKE